MKVFKDLMWYFKQEKKYYITGILMLALVSILQLVPPRIVGIVVDGISNDVISSDFLVKWLGIMLLAAVLTYGLRYVWRIMIFGSSVRLARYYRNRLYEHFTTMPQTFYQKKRIGDLMAHATNDIQAIQQTAGAGVLTLADSVLTGGFVLIAMALTISWKLTLISLIPMPIMAFATSRYGTLLHQRFHKAQEAFSELNDKVQESMNGIKVIKTFGQEKEDIESFKHQSADVVNKNIAVARVDALFDPTISLIVGLSYFLAIAFGARFVLQGEISLGQLISFTAYLGLLVWPMLAFGWLFNIVERGRASYDRVTNLLSIRPDIEDRTGAIDEIPSGDIRYRIDSFTYPGAGEAVLKDILIDLKKGQTLGIAGKTGSGKTTLLKLLIREFDVKDGEIVFGRHAISDYRLEALRGAVGYVPQDHFLFSATIADNIAFAQPDAPFQQVHHAAMLAKIHDDILQFTDGYETMVGERGVTLSGGQKQRLSIARALIMDPEVLILDDSLSAVDAKTEVQILQALRENRNDKTTIITAHRLSAIEHADIIIVLDEGQIIQRGTHQDLVESDGWYKEMYRRQQLESLLEHGGERQ